MESLVIALLILFIASCIVAHGDYIVNIFNYGAKGDGSSDDTQAFQNGWNAICGSNISPSMLVLPADHTFLIGQLWLRGPCKSNYVQIKILGNILAPTKANWQGPCSNRWLSFVGVNNLKIYGHGTIDGQGQSWWGRNNGPCKSAPTATVFDRCNGLQIHGIRYRNGPKFHLYVVHSTDVTILKVSIRAPADSPNTDGINISNSQRINIHNSIIGTGDDCIAVKGGTQYLNISNIACGPGHGISVGSLGEDGDEESVNNVNVWNCTLTGTFGGVKVKTWPGGKGHANAITFQHIRVTNSSIPVMIDQHYMHTTDNTSAVKVSDVTFSDVYGTCSNDQAVILDCAHSIGCSNIRLDQINLKSIDPSRPANATCNHAQGTSTNIVSPPITCLS